MKRFLVPAVAATAAAVALTGVLTASATAQPSPSPRTIHFTLVRQPGGWFPSANPQPGETLGAQQAVTGDDGSKGTGNIQCTIYTANQELCDVVLRMSTGQIAFQGIVPREIKNTRIIVTGGTGAYAVARGSAVVNDVTETVTSFTVKLPA